MIKCVGVYNEWTAKTQNIKGLHCLVFPISIFLYISHCVKAFCIYLCLALRVPSYLSYLILWSFHLGPIETGRESERIKKVDGGQAKRELLPSWTETPRPIPVPPLAGFKTEYQQAIQPCLLDFSHNCFLQTQLIHGLPGCTFICGVMSHISCFFRGGFFVLDCFLTC